MFSDFKLIDSLQRTLAKLGLDKPTEIQAETIPLLLEGKSVVGMAQTGTGKTLAFVLPILHRLKQLENDGKPVTEAGRPRAAVIVPTRELGEQVLKVFKSYAHESRLRVRPALGGTSLGIAKKNTQGPFDVLIATPGRLLKLLEGKTVSFDDMRMLVFDEADQMLDPTFVSDAKIIAKACPSPLQLGLFSATISQKVQQIISELFTDAEVIRAKNASRFSPRLITKTLNIENGIRFPYLKRELEGAAQGGTLIFVNTRAQCDEVAKQLLEIGQACVVFRGDMDKNVRRSNLKDFRDGKVKLLVSTDLASRGLDVERVSRVINYHLPQSLENYVHRVGRTARAGRKGLVVNLVTERDQQLLTAVENGTQYSKS